MNGVLKFLQVLCHKKKILLLKCVCKPLWLGKKVFTRVGYQSSYPAISFVVSSPGWAWWEGFREHKGTCFGDGACSSVGDTWPMHNHHGTLTPGWPGVVIIILNKV